MSSRILIVDDEQEFASSLAEYLNSFEYDTSILTDPTKATAVLARSSFDLILLDIRMPQQSGLELLQQIRAGNEDIPVIMLSGYASVENIVRAMRVGAHNFFEKQVDLKQLLSEIQRLIGARPRHRNRRSVSGSDSDAANRDGSSTAPKGEARIITTNPRMLELLEMVRKSADTNAPVLITGESGTGKELVAGLLQAQSPRHGHRFIKLNCAAIPDNLMESELFGYEAGAFTDARTRKPGKFEIADGGTIFLDELGEMSMNVQAKLLRVIQDGTFERLGGSEPVRTDVRIICATNRDIERRIDEGLFRQDLFYRLAVVQIELPPLRQRREDILPLADHFLAHYRGLYARPAREFTDEVKQVFLSHNWLGNVRELKNAIERAVIFSEAECIGLSDLPRQYREIDTLPLDDFSRVYESLSREMILEALKKANGRKQKAAELLNVHRKTLYNRMKRLGIDA